MTHPNSEPPRITFTGWNGHEIEFSRESALRLNKIDGLGGAPGDFVDTVGAGQAGVTFIDMTNQPNVITLEVRIGPEVEPGTSAKGTAGVEIYRNWRRALGRGRQVGRLQIEESGRFQMVRAVMSTMPPLQVHQMHNVGYVSEVVQVRSDESWWRSEPFDQTFAYGRPISVRNDGDEESWPYYEIIGPITRPVVGLLGENIEITKPNGDPLTVAAGKKLFVNTDPDYWEVTDEAGVDYSWLGERWHKKAPPADMQPDDGSIPVTFTGSGTSAATKLRVVIPHLYWMAI